jgi:hypothetical protein
MYGPKLDKADKEVEYFYEQVENIKKWCIKWY